MTNDRRELPKLPQARMYLKTAQWGFDQMIAERLVGYAFRLHLVGILASLRAVQHSLIGHDQNLSTAHKQVIGDWLRMTSLCTPDLHFIKTSRDQILKGGSFKGYATNTESSTGEGTNLRILGEDYDLAYYDEAGKRHDLQAAIRSAIHWCDAELSS